MRARSTITAPEARAAAAQHAVTNGPNGVRLVSVGAPLDAVVDEGLLPLLPVKTARRSVEGQTRAQLKRSGLLPEIGGGLGHYLPLDDEPYRLRAVPLDRSQWSVTDWLEWLAVAPQADHEAFLRDAARIMQETAGPIAEEETDGR